MPVNPKFSGEEAHIKAIIDALANAMRAKDADGIVSLYSADNVMFILAPPLRYTPETSPGKKGVQEWFDSWQGPIDQERRELSIVAGDGLGYAHSLNHMTGSRTDGTKTDLWYRETLCFRKIAGQWKITHQHQSVPFYMDGSGRAALDLKP
jgi:PhnB protein